MKYAHLRVVCRVKSILTKKEILEINMIFRSFIAVFSYCVLTVTQPLKLAIACKAAASLRPLSGQPLVGQLLLQRPAGEAPGPRVSCVGAAWRVAGNEPAPFRSPLSAKSTVLTPLPWQRCH